MQRNVKIYILWHFHIMVVLIYADFKIKTYFIITVTYLFYISKLNSWIFRDKTITKQAYFLFISLIFCVVRLFSWLADRHSLFPNPCKTHTFGLMQTHSLENKDVDNQTIVFSCSNVYQMFVYRGTLTSWIVSVTVFKAKSFTVNDI